MWGFDRKCLKTYSLGFKWEMFFCIMKGFPKCMPSYFVELKWKMFENIFCRALMENVLCKKLDNPNLV